MSTQTAQSDESLVDGGPRVRLCVHPSLVREIHGQVHASVPGDDADSELAPFGQEHRIVVHSARSFGHPSQEIVGDSLLYRPGTRSFRGALHLGASDLEISGVVDKVPIRQMVLREFVAPLARECIQ